MLRIASGQKFVDLSREVNGRLPSVWHSELIDQVTWCERPMRTSPAQKKAVAAPCQLMVISPPSTAGSSTLTAAQTTNSRLVAARAPSLSRSGAYRAGLVLL